MFHVTYIRLVVAYFTLQVYRQDILLFSQLNLTLVSLVKSVNN